MGGFKNLSLMSFASASQFHVYLPWHSACLAKCLNSALNVKALVATFNQERAQAGAFSVMKLSQTSV